jgi:hypothetical protein
MRIATSKVYGHDELHIPRKVINKYTYTTISNDTIVDWYIRENEIILKPRKKVSVEDIIGIISK